MNLSLIQKKLFVIEENAKNNIRMVNEIRSALKITKSKYEETDINIKGLIRDLADSEDKDAKS